MNRIWAVAALVVVTSFGTTDESAAGDVTIISAEAEKQALGIYRFSVTLKHDDEGWDHYANEWRVLAEDGRVLGTRTLAHPHVNEQPFTRSLGNVAIPDGTVKVLIDARDSVHGRTIETFAINLTQ